MFNKFKLHGDVNVESLVGGIDVLSDKENDVGGFFEQYIGQQRTAVFFTISLRSEIFGGNVFVGKVEQSAKSDDSFGGEVDSIDKTYGRYVFVWEVETGFELFASASCYNLGTCATTDDAFVGTLEELFDIVFVFFFVDRGTDHNMDFHFWTYADGSDSGVVTGSVEVEVVAG